VAFADTSPISASVPPPTTPGPGARGARRSSGSRAPARRAALVSHDARRGV